MEVAGGRVDGNGRGGKGNPVTAAATAAAADAALGSTTFINGAEAIHWIFPELTPRRSERNRLWRQSEDGWRLAAAAVATDLPPPVDVRAWRAGAGWRAAGRVTRNAWLRAVGQVEFGAGLAVSTRGPPAWPALAALPRLPGVVALSADAGPYGVTPDRGDGLLETALADGRGPPSPLAAFRQRGWRETPPMVAALVAAAPTSRVLHLCLDAPWVYSRRAHTDLGATVRAAAPGLVDVAVSDITNFGLYESIVDQLIAGATAAAEGVAAVHGGSAGVPVRGDPCLPRLRRLGVPVMSHKDAVALSAAAPGLHTLRLVGSTNFRLRRRRLRGADEGHPSRPLPPLTRGGGAATLAHLTLIGDAGVALGSLAPALAALGPRLESLHLGAMSWDVAALLEALPAMLPRLTSLLLEGPLPPVQPSASEYGAAPPLVQMPPPLTVADAAAAATLATVAPRLRTLALAPSAGLSLLVRRRSPVTASKDIRVPEDPLHPPPPSLSEWLPPTLTALSLSVAGGENASGFVLSSWSHAALRHLRVGRVAIFPTPEQEFEEQLDGKHDHVSLVTGLRLRLPHLSTLTVGPHVDVSSDAPDTVTAEGVSDTYVRFEVASPGGEPPRGASFDAPRAPGRWAAQLHPRPTFVCCSWRNSEPPRRGGGLAAVPAAIHEAVAAVVAGAMTDAGADAVANAAMAIVAASVATAAAVPPPSSAAAAGVTAVVNGRDALDTPFSGNRATGLQLTLPPLPTLSLLSLPDELLILICQALATGARPVGQSTGAAAADVRAWGDGSGAASLPPLHPVLGGAELADAWAVSHPSDWAAVAVPPPVSVAA